MKIAQAVRLWNIMWNINALQGVYIPHFDQITVKISVLGVLYPNRCTDGVKFGKEGTSELLSKLLPVKI